MVKTFAVIVAAVLAANWLAAALNIGRRK